MKKQANIVQLLLKPVHNLIGSFDEIYNFNFLIDRSENTVKIA